jgi:hypothetical protein
LSDEDGVPLSDVHDDNLARRGPTRADGDEDAEHSNGTQQQTAAASATTMNPTLKDSTLTAAPGSAARIAAMSITRASIHPARPVRSVPSHGSTLPAAAPARPTHRATSAGGTIAMFAMGAASETMPKVPATSGSVVA